MELLIDTAKTYQIMENIFKLVNILSVTGVDIKEAFEQRWKDFEDCVQYTIAKNNRVDYFVSANKKDFEDNSITGNACAVFFSVYSGSRK